MSMLKSHYLTLTLSHSLTISLSQCLTLSLFHSLIHSLSTCHSDNFGQTWGGVRPTLKKCIFFGLKSCSMSDQAQNTRCSSANTSARCLKSTSTILRRWASSSWSNSASEQATDLILMATPRFLGMANHLGPFSGSSD